MIRKERKEEHSKKRKDRNVGRAQDRAQDINKE